AWVGGMGAGHDSSAASFQPATAKFPGKPIEKTSLKSSHRQSEYCNSNVVDAAITYPRNRREFYERRVTNPQQEHEIFPCLPQGSPRSVIPPRPVHGPDR